MPAVLSRAVAVARSAPVRASDRRNLRKRTGGDGSFRLNESAIGPDLRRSYFHAAACIAGFALVVLSATIPFVLDRAVVVARSAPVITSGG